MSRFTDSYKALTDDQKANLGKGSSRISTSGAHLVSVDSIKVFGDSTLTITFTEEGKALDIDFNLLDFDTKEFSPKWAYDNLKQVANAIGNDFDALMKSEKSDGVGKKYGEDVAVFDYNKFNGNKLYIFTKTEISGDEKDKSKVWVNQRIIPNKYFSESKQDPVAQSTGAEANLDIFEIADTEAKEDISISSRKSGMFLKNTMCKAKLLNLQEKAGISTPSVVASAPSDPDEL